MTTPIGCLQSLTMALKRLAKKGNVEGLRTYARSEAFLRAFNGLDPNRRQSAMRSYVKAEALGETKARHPLVKPGSIDAKRAQKVNWSDPAMRAKLADAYDIAGGDDERAARILGVSLGSARWARKRHLDAARHRLNASLQVALLRQRPTDRDSLAQRRQPKVNQEVGDR
jgi:hypothetical protein